MSDLYQLNSKPRYGAILNARDPLRVGLVGFWPFLDGAGFADEIITGQATDANNASANYAWVQGVQGPGLKFNLAAPPVLTLRHASFDSGSNCTVLVWFNFAGFQPASPFISALWSDATTTGAMKQFFRMGDAGIANNLLQVIYSQNQKANTTTAMTTGWHCVGMVMGPNVAGFVTQTGWIDGTQVVSQTRNIISNVTSASVFGQDAAAPGREPSGVLQAVGIWSRALPAQAIQAIAPNPWQLLAAPASFQQVLVRGPARLVRRTLFTRSGSRSVA
jgi:hypothetical protein